MSYRTLIDAGSLRDLLDKPQVAIVDCRFDLMNPQAGRLAYLSGHIPGARYADLNRDLSGPITAHSGRHPLPEPQDLAHTLSAWGISNDTQVVAYDDANGSFAARLWWLLRWLGHTSVAVLDGGFKAWTAAGAPVDTATVSTAAQFSPQVDSTAWVSTDQLIASLRSPGAMLVDARSPERFAGALEPIDPVAGHVPGATNHPFTLNLDADGRFLPAVELRRRWQAHLAGAQLGNLVAMCGSGVTACHNLLALEVAGLTGAKLYAGSWSEWIRDAQRPVARG